MCSFLIFWDEVSHVVQTGLQVTMSPRLASNSQWHSCLSLQRLGFQTCATTSSLIKCILRNGRQLLLFIIYLFANPVNLDLKYSSEVPTNMKIYLIGRIWSYPLESNNTFPPIVSHHSFFISTVFFSFEIRVIPRVTVTWLCPNQSHWGPSVLSVELQSLQGIKNCICRAISFLLCGPVHLALSPRETGHSNVWPLRMGNLLALPSSRLCLTHSPETPQPTENNLCYIFKVPASWRIQSKYVGNFSKEFAKCKLPWCEVFQLYANSRGTWEGMIEAFWSFWHIFLFNPPG